MKDQSATPKFGAGRRGKLRQAAPAADVQSITNAAVPHSEEMHQRMVKYAVTMGIRMVCLAAIFVFDGWFRIIPIVGAVVLPWVAVMIANGGADINHQETVELLDEAPLYAVGPGETPMDDAATSLADTLTGEVVPDSDEDAPAGSGTSPDSPGTGHADSAGTGHDDAAREDAAQEEEKHHEHL